MAREGRRRRRRRRKKEGNAARLPLPIRVHAGQKLLFVQFQKRLPDESSPNIEYCCCQRCPSHLLIQFFKRSFHATRIRYVGTDADSLSARIFDFLDDGFVVFRLAGQQCDGIGLCELACYTGPSATIRLVNHYLIMVCSPCVSRSRPW